MMKYELFKEVIADRIMEFMPPIFADYVPVIEQVPKVNGPKDAIVLQPLENPEMMALPIVYLEDMYEIFAVNEDMDALLEMIAGIFIGFTGSISSESLSFDFEERRDSIILNVINSEINSNLLENIPHIDMLDVSIIFRVIMRWIGDGFDSVIISNHIMEEMGLELDELYRLALENSKRIFPPNIRQIDSNMYLVSNKGYSHGASVMVYDDFMQEIGHVIGSEDFYVIPSSIHEFMAVPSDEGNPEILIKMLANGNALTKDSEILSNSVYFYDSSDGSMRKTASYGYGMTEQFDSFAELM